MELSAISGSHGFIGRKLKEALQEKGHKVIPIDRSGILKEKVDYIFDLATYGNMHYHRGAHEIYSANIMRLINLLNTARFKGMVVTSTSSVDLSRQTFYSASKKSAELLVRAWIQEHDSPIVIARPYSITGAGEQDSHLIPRLISSCLSGKEMPFVPEPAHDFVDVNDLVDAYILLAKNASKHKGEVFKIGTGRQYTNQEVRLLVEKITGHKATTKLSKGRVYDSDVWIADPTKMNNLGWKHNKNLEDSITDLVNEYFPGV